MSAPVQRNLRHRIQGQARAQGVDDASLEAREEMASREDFFGVVTPDSQRLTVAGETSKRAANCSCVRLSWARIWRRVAGKAGESVMCAWCAGWRGGCQGWMAGFYDWRDLLAP
ncbi:MAG: hypothetical protein FWD57_11870 [Polyangiaceae bacterium]|nr:hypothetical protein [Polyangiaceae bacterium]